MGATWKNCRYEPRPSKAFDDIYIVWDKQKRQAVREACGTPLRFVTLDPAAEAARALEAARPWTAPRGSNRR